VAVESLPDLAVLLTGCIDAQAIQSALQAHTQTLPQGMFEKNRQWIDSVYANTTVETILAAMESHGEPDAKTALREIVGKSPTSVKVALRLLQEARIADDLRICLQREYDAALTFIRNHDFVEGVRAAVVDKDRAPHWSPASLADVTPQNIDLYFRTSPDTALF
jgi:enoyl-CoA hydratase